MTAHDLNAALLAHARALGLLPTATHRLGIDALRQISLASGTPLKALRRWNNQRNYRLAHEVRKRPCFVDKDGRDFLRAAFQQDANPSPAMRAELAAALGVGARDVSTYFRRLRYVARQRALGEAAQDFIIIPPDATMGGVLRVGRAGEPGQRACVFRDVEVEEL